MGGGGGGGKKNHGARHQLLKNNIIVPDIERVEKCIVIQKQTTNIIGYIYVTYDCLSNLKT